METRREVQFVIEQLCPQMYLEHPVEATLPMCVWVLWPPEKHRDPPPGTPFPFVSCDTKLVYRLTEESAHEAVKGMPQEADVMSTPNRRYVCEHMGHVIE